MTFEEIAAKAETLLAPFSVGAVRREDHRVDVVVKRESLCDAVKALVETAAVGVPLLQPTTCIVAV